MKIQIHNGMDNMSTTGLKVLGDLQDKFTPLADLLVRESVQNSADASMSMSNQDNRVYVSYSIFDIDNKNVIGLFEGIEEPLRNRFSMTDNSKCLVIRDKGTVGLTGYLRKTDVPYDLANAKKWGNLIKLVYEIREAQQNSGSGGCWGLGKTVYFRIGIGIVVYYSRVKEDGEYKSRLAACMVEDETSTTSMIPVYPSEDQNLQRKSGIAWWGDPDGYNKTIPLTDDDKITEILNKFNVKPYCGTETGTTIIIPFIDEKKLLDTKRYQTMNDDDNEMSSQYWSIDQKVRNERVWLKSLDSFLELCVQRWYYPRLDNPTYSKITGNRYLEISINGQVIKNTDMLPIFRLQQALYNRAGLGRIDGFFNDFITENEYYRTNHQVVLGMEEIRINTHVIGNVVGYVAFARANKQLLQMLPPDYNADPYKCFDISPKNPCVVVAYCRKPGMIVWYDYDKIMDPRMPLDDDDFIVAHFALKSNAIMKSDGSLLEDYIRSTEKANHKSWDYEDLHIVKNTIKQVNGKISAAFEVTNRTDTEEMNSGLSGILSTILPPRGYGKRPTGRVIGKDKPLGKSKLIKIIQYDQKFEPNSIIVPFKVEIKKNFDKEIILELQVRTESGNIALRDLKEKYQVTQVPFEFKEVSVNLNRKDIFVNQDEDNYENDEIKLTLTGDSTFFVNQLSIKKLSKQDLSFSDGSGQRIPLVTHDRVPAKRDVVSVTIRLQMALTF